MANESPTLVQSPGFVPEPTSATFSPADSSFSFPNEPPTSVPNANRRRKSSTKGTPSAVIKRSMSSPNVRGLSSAVELPGSLAEKRRNKLGYHRTSVACVHCRRRKIRCLLAADDHQNRCSNCIRLKKECNFFPVDQQPSLDRRPRAGSKTDGPSGENSGSSSSSPTMPSGPGLDHLDHFGQLPYMPMGPHPYAGNMGPATLSPPGSAALLPGQFDYPEHHGHVGWDSQFYDSPGGHSTPDGGPQSGFWIKPETPLTPSYSPFTSAPPGPPFPARNVEASFPSPIGSGHHPARAEPDWQQPTRSMSYSHLEGLAHAHQQHGPEAYSQVYQPELRRNTSDMLPPSLRNSSIGSSSATTSVPDASMVPMSAPPLTPGAGNPQSPYHFSGVPPPTAWASLPNQSGKGAEFGSWYTEPSQLAKVQEEEVPPHLVEDHIGMYPSEAR